VTIALGVKRLELLREIVPKATAFAMIVNPNSPNANAQIRDAQDGARAIGQQIHVFNARTENDVDVTFEKMAQQKIDALLVGTDPFLTSQRGRLVGLAERHRIPAIYALREYAVAGGLMSYGASLNDSSYQL